MSASPCKQQQQRKKQRVILGSLPLVSDHFLTASAGTMMMMSTVSTEGASTRLLPSPFTTASTSSKDAGPLSTLYERRQSPARQMVDEDEALAESEPAVPSTPPRNLIDAFLDSTGKDRRHPSPHRRTPSSSRNHSRHPSFAAPPAPEDQFTSFDIYQDPEGDMPVHFDSPYVDHDDEPDQDEEMMLSPSEESTEKENARPPPRTLTVTSTSSPLATPPSSDATTAPADSPAAARHRPQNQNRPDSLGAVKTPSPVLSPVLPSPNGESIVFPEWSVAAAEEASSASAFGEGAATLESHAAIVAQEDMNVDNYGSGDKRQGDHLLAQEEPLSKRARTSST